MHTKSNKISRLSPQSFELNLLKNTREQQTAAEERIRMGSGGDRLGVNLCSALLRYK